MKDSCPGKIERRPQILVKLSFRGLCDSKLSELHTGDNMANSVRQKNQKKSDKNQKDRLWVYETLILEVIFVTRTESVLFLFTNNARKMNFSLRFSIKDVFRRCQQISQIKPDLFTFNELFSKLFLNEMCFLFVFCEKSIFQQFLVLFQKKALQPQASSRRINWIVKTLIESRITV